MKYQQTTVNNKKYCSFFYILYKKLKQFGILLFV